MRAKRILAVAVSLSCLAGCGESRFGQGKEMQQALTTSERANAYAAKNPVNRFQLAGKREYSNGTEIYVLDTQSGQVCYYFIADGRGDSTALKADMSSCAGASLAIPIIPE